uniref:Uncharacterized protein n=1 Tax=Rhizophora mucronata TaxID=61149 RepID=A0A2P2QH18_RHIMU
MAKMKMLRWICGQFRKDQVRNEGICSKV